jgi:hypothetical protein
LNIYYIFIEGKTNGVILGDCSYHVDAAKRPCIQPLIKNYNKFMSNKILCSGTVYGSHQGSFLM